MNQDLSRRRFFGGALAMGSLPLWSGTTGAAEKTGARLVADNQNDTIQDIDLYLVKTVRMSKSHFTMIRIRTANGLTGYGECYTVDTTLKWLSKYMESLKGRKLSGLINRFYLEASKDYKPNKMHHSDCHQNMGWASAVSCLEIALWDILGKMANQPIHAILGGAVRDKIHVYANHAMFYGEGPSKFERILRAKELGYDMFKWPVFGGQLKTKKPFDAFVDFVAKVREAVGPDFKIAIDAHCRWGSIETPKRLAKALEPLDLCFFEEPFAHQNNDLFAELADSTSIPLATGEHLSHPDQAHDLLKTGAITYFQPDVGNFGGIAAVKNTCHVADAFDVKISTHNWVGPLTTLATLNYNAVIPNFFRQEWAHTGYGQEWETELISPSLTVENSFVTIPQGPGLGAELDIKALEKRRITPQ